MLTIERVGPIEIRSDGKSVWVNLPDRCAHRLSPFKVGYIIESYDKEGVPQTYKYQSWVSFCNEVRDSLGIELSPYHRPAEASD